MNPLLHIENLSTRFHTDEGVVHAVRNVNLQMERGKTLALVGESGCGKSVTALSVLRLIPTPPGQYASGRILFENNDLLNLPERAMEKIRGNEISMIFQEPMTSLNPLFTIGSQVADPIILHQGKNPEEARELALEGLKSVGLPSPEKRIDQYPHELSGGMKQRVMIAMAVACKPKLLIADEPTTALDTTVQAQILELLESLRKETNMAILLITHNLGIVAQYADRVAVMYAGKIIEEAPVETLFESPAHPYTRGLLNSLPKEEPGKRLEAIPGTVPYPGFIPEGCAFHPRCSQVMPHCKNLPPPFFALSDTKDHQAACWLYGEPDEGNS
ncbi:MAG: ABC transporter ATP-binding protein [Nitrospinae bacterium]|nr:ABC transporter ATP-binding protein [Nitrospinota bacterium]